MERRSERIFGQRYGCRPVKIDDLNMHLMCVLCGGYYIDATTIIECLHSFCRSCIVRYLETSSRCPICDVLVHKAQPLLNIRFRLDKLEPRKLLCLTCKKEMNSRREFYSQGLMNRKRGQPQEEHSMKIQSVSISEEAQQQFIKTPNLAPADSESLSISLEYLPSSKVMESRANAQDVESRVSDSATDLMDLPLNEYADVRYLLCPAGFTVGGLKKFIRAKFDLPLVYQIDIFHGDECLENHFSMLDVAFIFQWQKKAPLHLRYSVGYVPRTKRKLTTSNSTRRQNSKENETLQSGPDKNGEENRTSSQHELTKSHHSICPSKTSKHANSRTRQAESLGDHRKSMLCKDNGSTRVKQVGNGVMQDEKSSMSSRASGSGYRDIEEGEQHDCLFEDKRKENPKTSVTKDKRVLSGLTARGNTVSKDTETKRVNSDERIAEFQEFSETQCNRGNQTREETGQQTQTTNMAQFVAVDENIVHGTAENAELTIDLTGEDLNCSVPTLSTGEVDEVRSGSGVPSDFCPESVSRVVGSVTFVGNGSATVLSSHNSVLCSVGQIPVNGDIAKPTITLPCINAFKTLSCGLHSHQLSYASDSCSQIVGESVMTDDVMKIISTPEVTIVPSFGVQLIYSPDSVVSTNPICGVIQLPEAPISVTSDTLTRASAWSHSDVATNGIMNDADFQRLCEGKTIHAEKDFGGCFEHFVMPNLVESVGGKMSDEISLSYAVSLDSTASGPLPCVFVAQATGHQPPNSWGLPESSKDAETVDWGLCYPVAAAEFGTASLASISDEKLMERQPECSFVCVTSNSLPGSTTKPSVAEQLWSQGPYTDRNGTLETDTVIGSRGEIWAVESRQGEPRAVKMCIVEPQAVKRKAENNWAVESKEAKTSYMEESNTVITQQMRQKAVETRAEGNTVVEPQAVETQTMGLCAVESMPELWAVEPRPVEPKMMGPMALEQQSMETVTVGLLLEEIKTTSSCIVESSPEETQGVETNPKQLTLSKLNPLEETSTVEPEAVESISVELQSAQSQTVASWAAEESLVGPDDAELVAARTSTLEQLKSVERRETGVNHRTAETQSLDEDETNGVSPNALPAIDSSLTAVSEDLESPWETAIVDHREDTSVLQQNQHTAVEVNSADYVVENAIPGNSVQQLFELPAEEKFLFSGDNLAKFHDTSTNWSCSKEENQPTSATVNKDPNSESMPGLKSVDDVTVVPKTENSSVSASSEISSSLETEPVGLSTKPEDISYKVEDEPVSLEEKRLVIDMMEQKPVSAKAEDVPAPSDDADNVDILNNSYSDLSPSSEAMLCSTETTKLSVPAATEDIPVSSTCSAATEDIPVSSTCVNHCPVSAVDTGVLLVDESMSVSVTDDHVMVCIRGKEPPSVAEEGNSDAAKEIPVSNDESGITVLESSNEVPGTYDCKRTVISDACNGILVSDACNKVTASDDCSEVPISESCNIRPVTDVCDEVQISVTTWNLPFSAVTDQTAISNADETGHCVSKDIVQSLVLFDDTQVRNTTREDIIPCISNDSAVSNVPEKIPVSAVMVESELTNSSVGELPISVPIPTLPNYLPTKHSILTEDIPVSLTSSLETVPVCSSSLETTPFCTSASVQSVFYPLAISPLAGGYSNHVAQHVAIENQVMSGEELEEGDLSRYISTCGLDISEVLPVSQENLALGDINLRAVSVEMSWNDSNTEDKNSEQLDFTDKVKTNSVEERLVTDEDMVPSSLPLEFDNGKSTAGGSDQNFGLLDMVELGEDRVPGCGSKIIDSHMVTDNDQKSVENRVNLLPSGDSVATCAEKREKNEDKEEDGLTLSQRLLCSGSIIPEDEERHDHFRSTTRISHSFSFSNTSSGSLDCAVPSSARRRRSRSLDESLKLACAKQDNVELQSNRVPPIECVLLKEKTVVLNRRRDTVGLPSERVSGNHTVACGDKSSVPDELTVLNPSESCVGHVPVSAFRIQPFVTNMQDDTDAVNVSPMSDVVGISDEHADTCKFVAPDTIAFCDASCDNLKSNDSVLEMSPGETEMSDENPVDLI